MAGNVVTRQTLVDAGADDVGVGREKVAGMKIEVRKVRMRRLEGLKM